MEKLIETLEQHYKQNLPNCENEESVLDTLYWHYTEHCSSDSERIRDRFAALRKLVNFPPKEYDQVFYVVSDLCLEHGRLAFSEDFRQGMELAFEMSYSRVVSGR